MKSFLFFLLVFISSCINKTPQSQSLKDSSLFYYNQAKQSDLPEYQKLISINKSFHHSKNSKKDSLYSQILFQKNLLHLSLKQNDSLVFFNRLLVRHAGLNRDDYILGRQYYLMAYFYDKVMHAPDSAFLNYNLAKGYFKKNGNNDWTGRSLLSMGIVQKNQNDFFGSKETLTEALQYLNLQRDIKNIASCYNALATNHRKLLNFEDAEKYYLKSIGATDNEKDKIIYQNNLAVTYIDNKQFEKAISLLKGIVQDSILINNNKEYARVLDNLAYAKWLSEKENKADSFLEALVLRIQNNDIRGQIASYTHLGEFYSKTASQKAKSCFDKVIQLSKVIKMPRAEKDALKFLMALEPRNVKIRDRYVFLQDSLYEQELKVKTQFAKYKYDDKVKQESILRLEKENAEKELEASRQRNQKILSFGIGGFLLLFFAFLSYYYIQRSKHLRKEKETAAIKAIHDTEAELSRRLHDDFGGKLNHTMVMLQNDANTSEVMDVVEGLYNQSRDFSREINTVDTGSNFKNELLEMLRFRTPSNAKLLLSGVSDIDWENVSASYKTTLFKVLQELMINMRKHSKATLISIGFSTTSKYLKIDYADDGIGASIKDLHAKNGLKNTEKRIEAIKGSITFDSEKGKGFHAQIEVPK